MRPVLALLLVLLPLFAGCAVPTQWDPTRPRVATAPEDACVDAALTFEPTTLRIGERGTLRARFENCGDATIWHYEHRCGWGPSVKGEGENELWQLDGTQAAARRPPVCDTMMPRPEDLQPYRAGEVVEREWRWNAMVTTWNGEIVPAPAGLYELSHGFATARRSVLIVVSDSS